MISEDENGITESFKEVFDSKIAPRLAELENFRIECKDGFIFSIIASVVVSCGSLVYFFLNSNSDSLTMALPALVFMASVLIGFFSACKNFNDFADYMKQTSTDKLLHVFPFLEKIDMKDDEIDTFHYLYSRIFSAIATHIFPDNFYKSDIDGKEYTIVDASICREYEKVGFAKLASVLVLRIETDKNFLGHSAFVYKRLRIFNIITCIYALVIFLLLASVVINYLTLGFLPDFSSKDGVRSLILPLLAFVSLDFVSVFARMIEFNYKNVSVKADLEKKFEAKSTVGAELQSLMSRELVEKFLKIINNTSARGVDCAFYGRTILVSIETGSHLQNVKRLFKSVYDIENYKMYFDEMAAMVELAQYIKRESNLKDKFNN